MVKLEQINALVVLLNPYANQGLKKSLKKKKYLSKN
jgi:hypothetical protein